MNTTVELTMIDNAQTQWYDCFFERFRYDEVSDLFVQLEVLELDVDALAETDDLKRKTLSGWAYWVLYLRGYLQYCQRGEVDDRNIYWSYLTTHFGPRGHDPGLVETLADPLAARRRVALRFRDIDSLRVRSHPSAFPSAQLEPITLQVVSEPSQLAKTLYRKDDELPLPPVLVDGYHRLFVGRMFRAPGLHGRILWPFE